MEKNKQFLEKLDRTETFIVKLTKDESNAIAIAARRKGVTKSTYFRMYLLPAVRRDADGEL